MNLSSVIICLVFYINYVFGWTSDDLELFDIVEDVNQNFYELLNIETTATVAEVKRAYRKLSLQVHPDRNKEEDAELKFRQLSAVYEVLRDETKRQSYDEVLLNGLPDWRQPVFYYRRVRKLGLFESLGLVLAIATIGHVLCAWSMYLEKKYEKEEIFRSKQKKIEKKSRKKQTDQLYDDINEALEAELQLLRRPQWSDILPIQLVRWTYRTVVAVPTFTVLLKDLLCQKLAARRPCDDAADSSDSDCDNRGDNKRRKYVNYQPGPSFPPEMSEDTISVSYAAAPNYTQIDDDDDGTHSNKYTVKGEWTDDDISLLTKAVSKFPSGTIERWEKVAKLVGRPVSEVAKKARQIKTGFGSKSINLSLQGKTGAIDESLQFKRGLHLDTVSISQNDDSYTEGSQDSNRSADDDTVASSIVWTQQQQTLLEKSLSQYPRGELNRWDKIAECITGKTKDECITRFKFLADVVKKRKKNEGNVISS